MTNDELRALASKAMDTSGSACCEITDGDIARSNWSAAASPEAVIKLIDEVELYKAALQASIIERRIDQRWDEPCAEYDHWIAVARAKLTSEDGRQPTSYGRQG